MVTAPVAGSVTGPYVPEAPSAVLPPIQWLTIFVMTGNSFTDGGDGSRRRAVGAAVAVRAAYEP
ncbi:hypothetical protein TPA0906_49510 [Streptomyces olivaceus]|nr:hypothetical protein TPA0906_49510 [Streptomyces olivaceus]